MLIVRKYCILCVSVCIIGLVTLFLGDKCLRSSNSHINRIKVGCSISCRILNFDYSSYYLTVCLSLYPLGYRVGIFLTKHVCNHFNPCLTSKLGVLSHFIKHRSALYLFYCVTG